MTSNQIVLFQIRVIITRKYFYEISFCLKKKSFNHFNHFNLRCQCPIHKSRCFSNNKFMFFANERHSLVLIYIDATLHQPRLFPFVYLWSLIKNFLNIINKFSIAMLSVWNVEITKMIKHRYMVKEMRVVVVEWSAYSPPTQMIRVWIPLTPTVFFCKFCVWKERK